MEYILPDNVVLDECFIKIKLSNRRKGGAQGIVIENVLYSSLNENGVPNSFYAKLFAEANPSLELREIVDSLVFNLYLNN